MLGPGVKSFSENRFEEAKAYFESISVDQLSSDDRISYYHYLSTIYKSLGDHQSFQESSIEFLNYLLQTAHYKELYIYFCDLLNNEFDADITDVRSMIKVDCSLLNLGWKSSIEVGEVEAARKFSEAILDKYDSQYNFAATLKHLEERKSRISSDEKVRSFELKAFLYKGDVKSFDSSLGDIFKKNYRGTSEWVSRLFNDLKESKKLRPIIAMSKEYNLFMLGESGYNCEIADRKFAINILYQLLLLYPDDWRVIKEVMTYGIKISSKKIAEQARQVVIINPKLYRKSKQDKDDFDALSERVETIEDILEEQVQFDNKFDFATDLFSMKVIDPDSQKARGFEFLKNIGADDLAQSEKKKLLDGKKIDENHFVKFEKLGLSDGENIKKELINTLEYFSKLHFNDEKEDVAKLTDDRSIANYIRHGGVRDIEECGLDVAVALKEMKLNESALEMLELLREISPIKNNLPKKIGHRYVMVEVLKELGRYGDSLAILEEMLNTWALHRDEKLCFSYLAGENYRLMGDKGRALNWYLVADSIDSSYRLLEKRLEEFE